MTMLEDLPFHPIANLFPLIVGEEYDAFKVSVAERGVIEPVDLLDGMILDGRNRFLAWKDTGADPARIVFREYIGDDPLGYALARNRDRRHMTASQRALLAARLPGFEWGGDRSGSSVNDMTREDRAEMFKVGTTILDQAEDVVEKGVEDLTDAVARGDLAVGAAAQLAALPKQQQAALLATLAKDEDGHFTAPALAEIKKLSKEIRADEQIKKRERRTAREADLGKRQMDLPDKRFGVILADPPWAWEPYSQESGMDRAAENHYPTNSTDQIAALPVHTIAADDCVLFLYATVPMLEAGLYVMKAWGFAYKSHAIWCKDRAGTGYWFRNKHELLLVGTRGNIPAPAMGTQLDSYIMAPVGLHSAKPDAFLVMIETFYPTLPKIELNRRGPPRLNWSAWGYEAEPATEADDVPAETGPDEETIEDLNSGAAAGDAGSASLPAADWPLAPESSPAPVGDGADAGLSIRPPPSSDALNIPAFLRRVKPWVSA